MTEDFKPFSLFNFSQVSTSNPVAKIEQELVLQAKSKADLAVNEMQKMARVGHPVLRLAGLSGAAAVILGAYGAHGIKTSLSLSRTMFQLQLLSSVFYSFLEKGRCHQWIQAGLRNCQQVSFSTFNCFIGCSTLPQTSTGNNMFFSLNKILDLSVK